MRVVVTGSSGCLGIPLIKRLCDDPQIHQVVGIDLRPSPYSHPKFRDYLHDIRDDLGQRLEHTDCLIHLAFVVMPSTLGRQHNNRALIRDINLHGSIKLFNHARDRGVRHIIHLSSSAVYGAWPDNPSLMDEQQPLRAMPGFSYAEDKVAVERWLDQFDAEPDTPPVARLRPHVILGPHAQPLLRFLLRQPGYPQLPDPQPLTQCVWEDDVVTAILLTLHQRAHGAFNLAAEPALSFREMQQLRHHHSYPLPFWLLKHLHRLLWRFTGIAGEPGWFNAMQHSLAVSSDKARDHLGWQAIMDTYQCLRRLS